MALPPEPQAALPRRRWTRWLAGGVATLVLLAIVAWLAVPPIARHQLEARLTEALGRTTTVEAVAFDPFRLRLTVRNLAIAGTGRDAPLLAFDELVADVSSASLVERAPVLDAVRLTRPRVHVAREPDGRYSVQDLIDRALAAPDGPPPRFSLNNIELADAAVTFDDRMVGRRHELAGLEVAMPFLSSLPYQTEIRVVPRVAGTVNGSHFALAGTTTPFAEHREATLDVDLDALPLPPYLAYLPARPAHVLASAALTTRLTVAFIEDAAAQRRLDIRGTARLDDVAIRRQDGSPLVAARRIAVNIERASPLARDVRVASVVVDAPTVALTRRADGTLELAQPLFAATAPTAPATSSTTRPGWTVALASLVVSNGTLALVDETSGFRSTLVDVALDASNLTTTRGDKAHVRASFLSSDRIATFAGEADVEPLVPAASGRFQLAKFSLGLLFPYYKDALAVDVQQGSLDLAARFVLHPDGRLVLDEGKAGIADLRLALPGQKRPLWRIPSLAAEGIDVDVAAQRVTLGQAIVHEPTLRLVRERDGTLEMARFVRNGGGTAKDTQSGGWTVLSRQLTIRRASIDAQDSVPEPDVKLAVRGLDATIQDLSNAPGSTSRWALRARVGDRGRIAFNGPLVMQPFALSGTLDTTGLALTSVKPYVEPHVNVVVTDGTLTAKGRFAVNAPAQGPVRAAWRGDLTLSDFAALDKPTSSDLARWKSLVLEDLDVATAPFRAAVGRIALGDFFARVIVYPDATLNLARLVTPGESPEPAAVAAAAATTPVAEAAGLPLSIGRIEVARGRVDFTDLFIRPNYSADLTDVAGSVTTLSREQAGDVMLTASVEGTAPVEVQGRIHPFAPALTLDLAGKARDVDLPPLTPYSVKYAGYGIEKGKLTFDVRYVVADRKLSAQNRLVLDQLTFGPRVESPTATKLPVLLAVALLKDARGVIDIELPIGGSLDDPQFSVGGLIVRVIVNLITKAVTAPFALLGAVFGGGEELSTLAFAGGSAMLDDAMVGRVDALGKALSGRPALKLDIGGRADPAADAEALRHASVERLLRAEKMKALAKDGKAPASVDEVVVAADERERWLKEAYRAAPIAERPRNMLGMLKDVPAAEMEAMLFARASVDDEALRRLAAQRAQAVKDALVARGVAGERLFLLAPKLGGEAGGVDVKSGDKARAPARVDLALR